MWACCVWGLGANLLWGTHWCAVFQGQTSKLASRGWVEVLTLLPKVCLAFRLLLHHCSSILPSWKRWKIFLPDVLGRFDSFLLFLCSSFHGVLQDRRWILSSVKSWLLLEMRKLSLTDQHPFHVQQTLHLLSIPSVVQAPPFIQTCILFRGTVICICFFPEEGAVLSQLEGEEERGGDLWKLAASSLLLLCSGWCSSTGTKLNWASDFHSVCFSTCLDATLQQERSYRQLLDVYHKVVR